jgi:hypothetical protein
MDLVIATFKNILTCCITDTESEDENDSYHNPLLAACSYAPAVSAPQMSQFIQTPPAPVSELFLPRTRKAGVPSYPGTFSGTPTGSYLNMSKGAGTFPSRRAALGEFADLQPLPFDFAMPPRPLSITPDISEPVLPKVRPSKRRQATWYLFPQQIPGYKSVLDR